MIASTSFMAEIPSIWGPQQRPPVPLVQASCHMAGWGTASPRYPEELQNASGGPWEVCRIHGGCRWLPWERDGTELASVLGSESSEEAVGSKGGWGMGLVISRSILAVVAPHLSGSPPGELQTSVLLIVAGAIVLG